MQELPEGAGVTPRVSPRSSSLTAGDILAPAPLLLPRSRLHASANLSDLLLNLLLLLATQ